MGRSSRERAAAPLLFLAMVSLMTLQTLAVAGHPGPVVPSVCLSLLGGDGRRCTVAGGNSISAIFQNCALSGLPASQQQQQRGREQRPLSNVFVGYIFGPQQPPPARGSGKMLLGGAGPANPAGTPESPRPSPCRRCRRPRYRRSACG